MNITRENHKIKPERWARYKYNLTTPMGEDGKRLTGCAEHVALSKKVAGEGMVLLENNGILPLRKGTKIALFGEGTLDYIKGGGGSGIVYCAYSKNIYEGFKSKERDFPVFEELIKYYYDYSLEILKNNPKINIIDEPIVPDKLINEAADFADVAIYTLHRYSREATDRISSKGDFYLTDTEQLMVDKITSAFKNVVVVLNVGGMVDVEWFKSNPSVKAALLAWQAGMEGGQVIADIICGDINPSGKLTDTFAKNFSDYPSADTFAEDPFSLSYYEDIYVGYRYFNTIPGADKKINYPFGYGLSYTDFEFDKPIAKKADKKIVIDVNVKNTGSVAGKEVMQFYYSAPQGKLGKPKTQLAAFKKTALLSPGEQEHISVSFKIDDMASYDDLGKCCESAYILEGGDYLFFAGNSSLNLKQADYVYTVSDEFTVTKQLSRQCAPNRLPRRMLSDGSFENLPSFEVRDYNPDYKIPNVKTPICDKNNPFMLIDVAQGKLTVDEFMAQFTVDELIDLLGGHDNHGVANTFSYGGVKRLGVPEILTVDGPAGIRIKPDVGIATTAWPCATLIACTWDTELIYQIGKAGAKEAKENGLAVWLTPALNIHRNPLCGRNFEYFSEDPLIAGKFAAAEVNGIQSENIGASAKHFACNNREENRRFSDSRVSERALREIYIRGFEICVKEASPWTIMTSYNAINNVMACENYELITGILRGEWGFKGMVTSDWTPMCYQPRCVKAGNDVRMPNGFTQQLKEAYDKGEISRAQLEKCAKRVVELILNLE